MSNRGGSLTRYCWRDNNACIEIAQDYQVIDLVTRIKGQGLAPNREYWHDIIGYNYRMTNICAAIGVAQLERAAETVARKRQVAEWYKEELADVPVTVHGEHGDVDPPLPDPRH